MALLSLISALMSLIFGCIYILRFSAMRTMRKAAKWAEVGFASTERAGHHLTLSQRKRKSPRPISSGMFGSSSPYPHAGSPGTDHPLTSWSDDNPFSVCRSVIFFCVTVICFIWTSGDSETLDAPVTPPADSASPNPGGNYKPTPGVTLCLRVVETLFFVVGVVYFVMVIRTFRVWSSIGAIPLRAGERQHSDVHRLKEDNVTSPPPARRAPGGTGQGLKFVVEPKEGESSQRLRPTDQQTDTDEKHYARSSENQDTAPIQVIVSKDEMPWEEERERLYETASSEDLLPEVGGKTGYVGALSLEPGRVPEGSSGSNVPLRSTDATSPPTIAFGPSTHD